MPRDDIAAGVPEAHGSPRRGPQGQKGGARTGAVAGVRGGGLVARTAEWLPETQQQATLKSR